MPVFAFVGSDELRKQEALEAELARWEKADSGAAIRESHFGEELNAAAVAESYESPDLFAPRKSMVLRNFDKIHAAGQRLLEKSFLAENPQVADFLAAEKLDGRSQFSKTLAKQNRLFEYKLPYDNKIPAWLAERARRYGRALAPAEARLLQDIVGNDTSELDQELEKLDTFLPKGKPVTAEAILNLVSPLRAYGIFEFQNTAGHKNPHDFLPALRNLLDNGTEAFAVVMRLFSHFLTLARIRALLDAGAGEREIAETCKLHPFLHIVKDRYPDQARTRTLGRWKQSLARLARMEWEMKQGRHLHRFEVEMALADLVLA
jgi:DNA polymerase-3 subunit delta